MSNALEWYRVEGRKAAEERLKEIVLAAPAEGWTERGKLVREAVAALPDRAKWNLLPEELRTMLEGTLMKLEIAHHAQKVCEAVKLDLPEALP